ncbi:hypothetical protein DFH09DRAFT_1335689 [Mycena vulgaris]|nr:hypothetical protein DFH09DRAFT_1335689 [Mycena vulgaris]
MDRRPASDVIPSCFLLRQKPRPTFNRPLRSLGATKRRSFRFHDISPSVSGPNMAASEVLLFIAGSPFSPAGVETSAAGRHTPLLVGVGRVCTLPSHRGAASRRQHGLHYVSPTRERRQIAAFFSTNTSRRKAHTACPRARTTTNPPPRSGDIDSNLCCTVANPDTTYPLPATDVLPAHQLPPLHATQNPQIFRCVPRAHQSLPARPSGFLIERRHDEFLPTTHHFWLQLPARLGHAISPHLCGSNSRNAIVMPSPPPSESHPPHGSAAINTAELKLHVWAFRDRPQHAITALAAAVAPQNAPSLRALIHVSPTRPHRAILTPPPIFEFWIYSSRERGIFRAPAPPRHAITAPPPPPQHPDAPITPSIHRRAPHLNFGFRVPASQVTGIFPGAARRSRAITASSTRRSPPRSLNSAFRAPASNITPRVRTITPPPSTI